MNVLVHSRDQLNRLLERNEAYRTYGAIISDHAHGRTTVIRRPVPPSDNWIVFEEYTRRSRDASMMSEESSNDGADRLVSGDSGPTLRSTPALVVHRPSVPRRQPNPLRESNLISEFIGASLSCTFAAGAGVSLVAEGGVTAVSGGTAAPAMVGLAVLSWTNFATGSVQCGLGAHRFLNELTPEGREQNDRYDNDDTYQRWTTAIDAIGIFSSIPSLVNSFRTAYGRAAASIGQREAPLTLNPLRADSRLFGTRARKFLDRLPEAERGIVSTEFGGQSFRVARSRSARQRFISVYNQAVSRVNSSAAAAYHREGENLLRMARGTFHRESVLFGLQSGINAMPGELVGVSSGAINALGDSQSQIRRDMHEIGIYIHIIDE